VLLKAFWSNVWRREFSQRKGRLALPFGFEGQPAASARQKTISFNSLEAMRGVAPFPKEMEYVLV
jgi:hypothetical protein